jgi:hypothetical protein
MNKFVLLLFLVLLFGLVSFSLLTKNNNKDGFANHQNFMEGIKQTIFNVITPYPSEILHTDIPPPLQNFCNVYGSSKCNDLTNENCKSSKCCILLNNSTKNIDKNKNISNPKCVGGNANGPTFQTDADSFYYMNKLYPNIPI